MHFSCADGIAYGDGVIYANLDLESKRWYDHRLNSTGPSSW
jgi:hypothetical protein